MAEFRNVQIIILAEQSAPQILLDIFTVIATYVPIEKHR